jgi:aminocarboxymuconate-semialdehyde decarboxylase
MPFPIGDLTPLKIVQETSFSDSERVSINGGLTAKLFGL